MPVRLTFRESHDYADDPTGAIRIPIVLRVGDQAVELIPKVDTGATYCVFKREHGEHLHLDIERGEPRTLETPAGGKIPTFGHTVTIECFGYSFESVVYFAEREDFDRDVLGRNGWLQQFRLGLIHHDAVLHISHYNDPN